MEDSPFFCECCQTQYGMGEQVELEDGRKIPICGLCWNQIPAGERIAILIDVRKTQALDRAIEVIAAWLADRKDVDLWGMN